MQRIKFKHLDHWKYQYLDTVLELLTGTKRKERPVHVPNFKSFLLSEAERKHVRRRARFQQHRDASCHQVFFPPARQGAERNSRYSDRNMHHRMPPSKTGCPSLNMVIFPTVMHLVLDDPKQLPPRRLLIKLTS